MVPGSTVVSGSATCEIDTSSSPSDRPPHRRLVSAARPQQSKNPVHTSLHGKLTGPGRSGTAFRNAFENNERKCRGNEVRLSIGNNEICRAPRAIPPVKAGGTGPIEPSRSFAQPHPTRRGVIGAAGSVLLATATPGWAAAPLILDEAAGRRSVHLQSARLGESVKSVYWVDGEYLPEALAEISHLLRDWRENEAINFDPRAINVLSAAQLRLETSEPFEVLSGYRTPKTNAMLRRRSSAVAKSSYHTRGMAVDVTLKSRSVGQMYRAAIACEAGGVGRYSRSQFVHMDCGPVRTWGQ